MTTKKTTSTRATTAKKPAPKKKPTAQASAPARGVFSLHLGQGFQLLTEQVAGGVTTAARVPAGAMLQVSYWKEPSHPQHPNAKLTRITMHARLDGETLPSLVVAQRDEADRLLRLAPALVLPEAARLLEYWFELETDANETLWDSNWGNNHWLELTGTATAPETSESARAQA